MRLIIKIISVLLLLGQVPPVAAQRTVPLENNAPVAPTGLKVPPLPDRPVTYETAEGQNIRVVVVARGLAHPWSIAFLPDGGLLVTERDGRLRIIRNDVLDPDPVAGVPEARVNFISGLLDVVLHPRFAENRYVYLSYNKPLDQDKATLAVARGVWDGKALTGTRDIFVTDPDASSTARLVFGRDGMLYMSTYGVEPQNPNNHSHKVLRLTDAGKTPPDNPYVGKAGYKPEIYTWGHRSVTGMAVHPDTGEIWELEMGPNGGDELNILRPGANYGWDAVSLGRDYNGPWHSPVFEMQGFERPVLYWTPSISVSGLTFYRGDKLPQWKGDVFVGGVRFGEIPGTGLLQRILFNEKMEELRRENLLVDLRRRIRDVKTSPDGYLYVLTDETDGGVLRIEPAN
jgi:glucose/arabinose dehydrogenase